MSIKFVLNLTASIILNSFILGCATSPSYDNKTQEVDFPERKPLDGIWIGEFDIGGRGPYDFTSLHLDGEAYAVSLGAKAICVGTVKLDGKNVISQYLLFALDGGPFDRATITGKLKENEKIVSHFVTLNGGDTGALNLEYNQAYDTHSSFKLTQGGWSFTDDDGLMTKILIEDQGTLSGNDSDGCEYLGYLDIINPAFNAYHAKIQISECGSVDGEYEGVSYLKDDRLNLHITNKQYGLFYVFSQYQLDE